MNASTPPPRSHTPAEIALRSAIDMPSLLPPEPASLFAERALRLRELAAGHAMRDYLMLMALVCEAQHARARTGPAPRLPTVQQIGAARDAGEPVLKAVGWRRDPLWRDEWRALVRQVLDQLPADSPARAGVQAAATLQDAALEQQAERLLAGITLGLDMASAPLIAAGLQLHWARLAAGTLAAHGDAFAPSHDSTTCPCCGSLPTASVTRVGGQLDGQRYLYCALCASQWHLPRVICTHCLQTRGIYYRALQDLAGAAPTHARPAIEAETCDSCRHYLKIVHMGRNAHVEPIADDLATVTLDLLAGDAGFTRHGTNLLLLFGDAEAEPGLA